MHGNVIAWVDLGRERVMLGYRNVGYANLMGMGNKLFNGCMAMVGHVGMGMLGYQFHECSSYGNEEGTDRRPL